MKKILIYDCEIIKAIRDPKKVDLAHIEYCNGWDDYENMGISVIGVNFISEEWDKIFNHNLLGRGVMGELIGFQDGLDVVDVLVGFNNQSFDDKLLKANGFIIPENVVNYDLLAEIWEGAGLGREFIYPTHAGFGLDAICKANGLGEKSGDGANAAILWQKGKYQEVIDYCENDIRLTRKLFDLIQETGEIKDPREDNFYFKKHNPDFEFKPIKVRKLSKLIKTENTDSLIQAKCLNAPRLTPDLIESKIVKEEYHLLTDVLTVCVLTLENGFTVIGESACASPANYNKEIGDRIARDNAKEKIWVLEGYLLKQKLFEGLI